MSAAYVIAKDADVIIEETFKDLNGDAVDIAGATISWGLLNNTVSFNGDLDELLDGTDCLFKKTTGDGITITDGANGVCEVSIDDADSHTIVPGAYKVLARATTASGSQLAVRSYDVKVGA